MRRSARSAKSGALDRRNLFAYGAASAALGIAGRAAGLQALTSPNASPPAAAMPQAFDLDELTIADLQKKMVSGEETARSLAEKYIARIEALDRRGPALRSVLEVNPDAVAIAEKMDAERKAGRVRG